MKYSSKEIARLTYEALDEKKGEDIKVLEISNVSVIADYFVIANGTNSSQVQALVDNVLEVLNKRGYDPKRIEGVRSTNWVLMDYGDVIVHIFYEPVRYFYDLESLWSEAETVRWDERSDRADAREAEES